MDRKNKIRTKGANNQWNFDNILSDLKDEELDILNQKYNRDLLYYRKNNDINISSNQKEYQDMQQRKKMIGEEKKNRKVFKSSLSTTETRFYPEEGVVLDSDNNIIDSIAFNQDETEIISLPSGTKGKNKKENWEPVKEEESDEDYYTMMSEVELSWEDWCKKKCLIQ